MKNLYEILDRYSRRLCYQVGPSASEAVRTARVYYGHRSAFRAIIVRGGGQVPAITDEQDRHAVGQPLRFPVFAGLRDARDL